MAAVGGLQTGRLRLRARCHNAQTAVSSADGPVTLHLQSAVWGPGSLLMGKQLLITAITGEE